MSTQNTKILVIAFLLLFIALDIYHYAFKYFNLESKINSIITGYALTLLIYFLTYRCYEKGGHWLLAPITYFLGGLIFSFLNFDKIIEAVGNDSSGMMMVILANLAFHVIFIVLFIHLYIRYLKEKIQYLNN